MSHISAFLVFLVLLVSTATAQDAPLPEEIRRELDATFGDWRLPTDADLSTGSDSFCPSSLHFNGDFDGDGQTDHVAQVIYRVEPDSRVRADKNGEAWVVAALLKRSDGFDVHIKNYFGRESALIKNEAGSEIHPFDSGYSFQSNGEASFRLQTDAITIAYCGKASSLYFYYGGAFIEATTGD